MTTYLDKIPYLGPEGVEADLLELSEQGRGELLCRELEVLAAVRQGVDDTAAVLRQLEGNPGEERSIVGSRSKMHSES